MNPRHERAKGTSVAREVWEQQYRSGGWDYLADQDEAGHYLAIAQFCGRCLGDGSVLDIGCGTGILVAYLQRQAGMAPSRYFGVDLAQQAVDQAAAACPGAHFTRLDYRTDTVPGRFDVVIFNETLYCFDDPVAILDKSIAENMHAGSLLIVSMYGEHHEAIWDAIAARCNIVDEQLVENNRVRWKVRVLRPEVQMRKAESAL
jgi:trans-aconitate methyltransferase